MNFHDEGFAKSRSQNDPQPNELIYRTELGSMYWGDSRQVLLDKKIRRSFKNAQLVFTSPPFPLVHKKKYGNLAGEKYLEWFESFAPILRGMLKENGSIVVEMGNAWEPRRPIMSTIVIRALLRFLERGGLNLCQEFVWYNPARLPSPAQWVTVERIRVKDAFTRIWWMSPTERPKADNRRVLREYSTSMKQLLRTKRYNSGKRPSAHVISNEGFFTDNGGSIPPNVIDGDNALALTSLLKTANTHSYDRYQDYCREHGILPHPARMPSPIAEFFIRFLTDKKDLVVDPFGGSNTTGAAAESLGRRWLACEANREYAASSVGRFTDIPNTRILRATAIKA